MFYHKLPGTKWVREQEWKYKQKVRLHKFSKKKLDNIKTAITLYSFIVLQLKKAQPSHIPTAGTWKHSVKVS